MTDSPTLQPATPSQPAVGRPTLSLKSRYAPFYQIMLILSSVGTGLGVFNLFSLGSIGHDLAISPLVAVTRIISYLLLVVSIWAMVLLWLKRPLGIWLRLGSYAGMLVITIIDLVTSGDTIKRAVAETVAMNPGANATAMASITAPAFYVGYGLTILGTIVFAGLWWWAWIKQLAADSGA